MAKRKSPSEALKGNKNGTKLKDPDIRQQAYKQYCDHISTGKPKECWYFEHPKFSCTYKTMDRYIAENPSEFPIIHREMARCKSYERWFNKGEVMVDGLQEKCQPAVYQMIMRNMFDWDKENTSQKESNEPLVKKIAKKWRGNFND